MISKILDNKMQGKVYEELQNSIHSGSKISVVSGYFTIYAYASLKKELNKIDSMRFLFTEPTFVNEHSVVSREFQIDHEKSISGNDYEIKLRNEMRQSAIAKECADWIRKKVEIKSLKIPNAAQPRIIHVKNDGVEDLSINGTVDFTTDGLGVTASDRIDSNLCMSGEATKGLLDLFEQIWNDSSAVTDVKNSVLEHMETLYKENPPEFIYYVTLYNIFHDYLDELSEDNIIRSGVNFKESIIWNKLYRFQKDGVMGIIDKIEKYNGCILADSVGLGKTFTALAVIKYYQSRNDRVLVLCPKKLRDNWIIYTQNDRRNLFADDRFNYDVVNHSDLSRESGKSGDIDLATINWGNYDLVVIDESHNFRNNPPFKGHVTRYQRLMQEIIRKGVKTKVLMLSATPVNNRLSDIRNQIEFITEGDPHSLKSAGITDINMTITNAQRSYTMWSNLPDRERTTDRFVEMMSMDYFKLLDTLTIARSRKHIEKYYDLDEIGKFPERRTPINVYSEIDKLGQFPSIGEVNKQLGRLNLGVYCPMSYLFPDKIAEYEERYDIHPDDGRNVLKQSNREENLVRLMRVNILKRLESSVHSYALTIEKVLYKIDKTIEKIDRFQSKSSMDSKVNESDLEDLDFDDPEMETLSFGSRVRIDLNDIDCNRWRQDLELDKEKLKDILVEAKKITPDRDSKLYDLGKIISDKIAHPINGNNRKIIVFSAFADTASYLYDNLAPFFKKEGLCSAMVSGSNENRSNIDIPYDQKNLIRISDLNTVLTLFSPISKERATVFPEFNGELDLMFCTDCISEGQNLQDCDYLINYDIHWNPVRIIQRFGRIDRIGSKNDSIQLVNFWPMKDLDEYINLQQRVRGKMVLLDVSATGEENIIEPGKEMRDLEYRKKQLQKLQEEVVDLEDIKGGISITDMTFSEFKTDLMYYLKDHRKILDRTPMGLHALVPVSPESDLGPGVVFVLKQLMGKGQTKEQNPMFPYYVAHISYDGQVTFSYIHAKRLLDNYKKLCCGDCEVHKDLTTQFNIETDDGHDMRRYSALLEKVISDIVGKKNEAGVASLFSRGGTTLMKSDFGGVEDFEIVTFLVIR
ncbi:MAG: helicase [Candidatus Methanarcanum hacksteinii]|nr:MAG: helicase [Candidatus Methanarcanum hacksteinii]